MLTTNATPQPTELAMMSRSALNPGLKTPAINSAAIAQGQIENNLMITAQVSPLDVESVAAGQKAKIRFTSLSSRRVPTVFGRVETVSSDAIYDESSKQSYYRARVAVDPASLPSSIATKLLPGMPAEILIVTGKRTVTDLGPSPKPSSSACAKREHGAMHPGKA